jgi:hypothetical protein
LFLFFHKLPSNYPQPTSAVPMQRPLCKMHASKADGSAQASGSALHVLSCENFAAIWRVVCGYSQAAINIVALAPEHL